MLGATRFLAAGCLYGNLKLTQNFLIFMLIFYLTRVTSIKGRTTWVKWLSCPLGNQGLQVLIQSWDHLIYMMGIPTLVRQHLYIDGLVQERHNSIANTLELHLSCTSPSICGAFSEKLTIGKYHNTSLIVSQYRFRYWLGVMAPSQYLNQCWQGPVIPYGVIKPRWF